MGFRTQLPEAEGSWAEIHGGVTRVAGSHSRLLAGTSQFPSTQPVICQQGSPASHAVLREAEAESGRSPKPSVRRDIALSVPMPSVGSPGHGADEQTPLWIGGTALYSGMFLNVCHQLWKHRVYSQESGQPVRHTPPVGPVQLVRVMWVELSWTKGFPSSAWSHFLQANTKGIVSGALAVLKRRQNQRSLRIRARVKP